MRLLFDLGHPAHVHLFRHVIDRIRDEGGQALAATRFKDVTVNLCHAYNIPQIVLSRANTGGFFPGCCEFFIRTLKLLKMARKFRPDALLGTSMSIGLVGRVIGRPSFVFGEDDADVVPLFAKTVYPVCNYVVTPQCLKHENYGAKHLCYPGYHELAYLHPDHFSPDPDVPRFLGLEPEKPYFLLRLVSLKAHHDVHASGLPIEAARRIVELLGKRGRLLIVAERRLREEFRQYQFPLPPEKFHHVLAFASMCIGDSQTVAAEAAVLGVPNLRCNSFVGRITYLEELEKTFGLTKGFLPGQTQAMFETVATWLGNLAHVKHDMQVRRKKMLDKTVNLAQWQWQLISRTIAP